MEGYLDFCYKPVPCSSESSTHPNTSVSCDSSFSKSGPNTSFIVWYNGDFEQCFEYLVFIAGFNALFGLASALYAGLKHTKFKRKKKPLILIIRILLSLCIVLNSLVELIGSFWLAVDRPYSVLLSAAVVTASWSVHILCVWVLGSSTKHFGRGPVTLHTVWFLTLIGSILKLRTVITWTMDSSKYHRSGIPVDEAYFSLVTQITTYVYFGIQVLYLVTLLFKVSRVTGDNVKLFPSQQSRKILNSASTQWEDSEEQSVRQNLISSDWSPRPTSYGTLVSGSFDSNRINPRVNLKELEASEDRANPFSLLVFWWVRPLMKRGALGLLRTPDDLLQLPKSLGTAKIREKFRSVVIRSEERSKPRRRRKKLESTKERRCSEGEEDLSRSDDYVQKENKWALFGNLNRAFGLHYYPLGVLKLVSDLLGFGGPLLLHQLVSFIENGDEPLYHGYLYALGLFLFTLAGAFLLTHFNFQINKVGMKIRAALITEIYRKALTVNATTLSTFSTGQVVNFMSTDTDRIVNFCPSFHQFWSLPFQIIISLGLLYQQVGLAFLAGLVFCILLIPVNRWLAVKIGKLSAEMMSHKDARVKVMSEVLTGIRVVKFYAWENNFIRKILGIRSLELKSLKGRKYLDALCVYFWATTPVLISILTFATYVAMGYTLTAAKVFTSVALFGILISPLNAFPWVINGLIEAWVSTKRVQAFLQLKELGQYYSFIGSSPSELANSDPDGILAREKEPRPNRSDGGPSSINSEQLSVGVQKYGTIVPVATGGGETRQSGSSASNCDVVQVNREESDVVNGAGIDSDLCSRDSQCVQWLSGGNVVQIRDGCFTWSKHDKQATDSVSGDNTRGKSLDADASGRVLLEEDDGTESADSLESSRRTEWLLSDINLRIKPGELIGVIGKVGSGKSSLLSAITAEMRKRRGEVSIACLADGFGLTTQEAWIQHATVRENIVFGKTFQAGKYRKIIHGCALEQDLQILPAGDRTEVGENGVTLSGGQKARVALARAVYQDKAVYLLDDPLAAVDAHVAAHLFTHCVMGLLRHKTRVLCTHHLRFLHEADTVIVMEGGRIVCSGPPAEVLPRVEDQLTALEEVESEREGASLDGVKKEEENLHKVAETVEDIQPTVSVLPDSVLESVDSDLSKMSEDDVLVKEEEKEVGVVKFSVYRAYWSSVGHLLAPTILLALLFMQASRNISDWWLSYWISNAHNESDSGVNISESLTHYSIPISHLSIPSHDFHLITNTTVSVLPLLGGSDNLAFYLGIYGGLAAANSVFTLLRAFLYAYGGVRAATVIHKKLLLSIIRAPVSFFDVTPIGRIINRFSSDLYAIDDSLPFIMNILLAQFYGILGTLVITCYGLPWFALLLVPLGLLYYHIQNYYRRTSRELKRLSTVTLSPVYAHFTESLAGLCTIRALRATERFMDENKTRVEVNQRANFGSYAVAQWLGIRLQMLGVAMVTGVAFIAVLEHHFNTVDPGLVGLAISYALSITNLLSGVVTSFTETEKEMVSVERAIQYIKGTPTEREQGSIEPPASWPSRGVVEFRKALLIYREGLPPALREIYFVTRPMENLGVVGRTGAGKSSLFQALFRMVELTSGCILIDGVNISSVSLDRLRSVLAVIPQDPFLFSGSVRDNLDPCQKHSDHELWSALERCHLRHAVRALGGIDHDVEEKGRVFSVGQRQLMCLARALLTHARVICIDEATASVDMETDSQIQQTIHSEFADSTVITIAHRIETVLNSDRILVMEQGEIRELGTPRELLDNHNSLFARLFREHTK